MYREYLPDVRLQHLIETYWVSDGFLSEFYTQRFLPDGCVDMLFNFTDNDGKGHLFPYIPRIVGVMTSHLNISCFSGLIQMLGIRFRPNGITAFSRIPVFELTDRAIDIDLMDTLFEKSFYDRLPEFSKMEERIIFLDQYLVGRLNDYFMTEKRIDHALEFISRTKGLVSTKQVAAEICLSERQLERRFKTAIGVSPKMFSRIIRFKSTVKYLQTYPDESLYMTALECGYFDDSHLIKDFKEFGGDLPKELI